MYSRIMLLLITLLMSSTVSAQEIKVQTSDNAVRFMYLTEAFGQDFGRLELELGLLYNKNSDTLFNAGILVRGEGVSIPVIVSIGVRTYSAKLELYDVAAIAIGGDLLLRPESWGGFGAGAYFFNSPSVITFGDASGITEYGAYVNFQLTTNASIALGYQLIEAEVVNVGDLPIVDGGYFGLNIEF